MANYYPPVGFYFRVTFSGISDQDLDTRFQSVSGLTLNMQTESIKEGGENRFEHHLPLRSSYQNLILKRGFVVGSRIIDWCMDTLENLVVEPADILVELLNNEGEALHSWNVVHAWPIKWSVSDFNAENNSVVIETLELNYQYFTSD